MDDDEKEGEKDEGDADDETAEDEGDAEDDTADEEGDGDEDTTDDEGAADEEAAEEEAAEEDTDGEDEGPGEEDGVEDDRADDEATDEDTVDDNGDAEDDGGADDERAEDENAEEDGAADDDSAEDENTDDDTAGDEDGATDDERAEDDGVGEDEKADDDTDAEDDTGAADDEETAGGVVDNTSTRRAVRHVQRAAAVHSHVHGSLQAQTRNDLLERAVVVEQHQAAVVRVAHEGGAVGVDGHAGWLGQAVDWGQGGPHCVVKLEDDDTAGASVGDVDAAGDGADGHAVGARQAGGEIRLHRTVRVEYHNAIDRVDGAGDVDVALPIHRHVRLRAECPTAGVDGLLCAVGV